MRHIVLVIAAGLVACSGGSSTTSSSSSTTGFPTVASASSSSSGATHGSTSGSSGTSSSGTTHASGSNSTGTATSSTGTSTSGAASTGTSSGGGGLPTACATPTLGAGLTLINANGSVGPPAIAWGGSEGAVVVSESTGAGWSIFLQRFNTLGQSVGSTVTLGSSMASSYPAPNVAVAANGSAYLACWDGATSMTAGVACATVPTGSGSSTTAAYTDTGSSPSLAFGAAGFVLADLSSAGALNLQLLTSAGAASGSPFTGSTVTTPVITATSAGYAVGYVTASGAIDGMYLDSTGTVGQQLTVFSATPSLAQGYPFALAASGSAVASVWYEFAATQGVFSDVGGAATPVLISGTGSSYGRVAVAGGNNSYAATWSDQGGSIMYVPLDATGTPTGAATAALSVNWDDNAQALVAISGGFVLASTVNENLNQVSLVLIGCP